jgi:hypothetical protein
LAITGGVLVDGFQPLPDARKISLAVTVLSAICVSRLVVYQGRAARCKPSLIEVAGAKWKQLLVGGVIGWLFSTAAFFLTPYQRATRYHLRAR